MTAREDFLNSRVERRSSREQKTARFMELDRMAEQVVTVPFSSAGDALTYLRLVVGHSFKRLTAFDTRHQTRSFFGKLASGEDFRGLARSMAAADALFAVAANENSGGEG